MSTSLSEPKVLQAFLEAKKPQHMITVQPSGMPQQQIPKPFPSPIDWRDQFIYFIVIDRFNNPSAPPKSQWDRATAARQGGTIEGIRQKLPYLADLGATALWLSPVFKNRQTPYDYDYHGYGIMDFLEVDPRLGTEAELVSLIDQAHARGIHIILDIVLNHTGNIFAYSVQNELKDDADFSPDGYPIAWRNEQGQPNPQCSKLPDEGQFLPLTPNAAVWPREFQHNEYFRRKGKTKSNDLVGDFEAMKELSTDYTDQYGDRPVMNSLIRCYQYIIAWLDIDGYRIDTMKHIERDNAKNFCNAIREYALSIGKKNFFIFGETNSQDETLLASYIGRFTTETEGIFGADSALDFPLEKKLKNVIKGFGAPTQLEDLFNYRKNVHEEKNLLSTHGDASRFFVTFYQSHDEHARFLHSRDTDYSMQLIAAEGCLMSLMGIPCHYYGSEQGLKGCQEVYENKPGQFEFVREAFWGKPKAFDQTHPIYLEIKKLAQLRKKHPALRYGRQYFRPVSGNNRDFGFSKDRSGILAFSRILNNQEVVTITNTSTTKPFDGWVLIDARLNADNPVFKIVYSSFKKQGSTTPTNGHVTFYDRQNVPSSGWACRIHITLEPMEFQVLTREN